MKTMSSNNTLSPTIKQTFLASTGTLFNAWITPFFAEQWLFKNDSNELRFQGEVKAGNSFFILESDGGNEIDHLGVYKRIRINEQLHFTLSVPKHFAGESEVTVDFRDTGFGCEMTFTQTGIDFSQTESAWKNMFQRLDSLLQSPYLVTETSTPEEIVNGIMVVLMQLVALARPLNHEEINRIPAIGGWSAGQLLNHVQKYFAFIGDTFSMPGKPVTRNPTANAISFRRTFLDQTLRMSSPDMLVPEQKNTINAKEIFAEFDRVMQPLKSQMTGVDFREELQGLPMGPVTRIEILLFTLYHTQRHLWQMAKISDLARAKAWRYA